MGRLYRIIFLFSAIIPCFASAQQLDCEQTLALAIEEYNAGHFHNVPSVLDDCLPKFNRDQRQRANLLLTQTYLLLDDPISTQRSFLEVLAANPEFVPDEQLHSIDIVYLSKRFTATPKFSWFVSAGSNVTPVSLIFDLYVAKADHDSYSLRPGYNFGVGGAYSVDDNNKVRIETNFIQTSYAMKAVDFNENDFSTFTDRQTWLNIPLYVAYSDNVGTYRPYGYIGYSVSKLFTDKASIALERVEPGKGEVTSTPYESKDYDFRDRRSQLNHSLIFGGGIKYKIGLDFVFVDLRYSAGLRNFINPDYSFGDPTIESTKPEWVEAFSPTSGWAHRDNYIRLNNCALTVGFLRPLYKPRELKRARTKGVLRKMKRAK